MHHCKSGVKPLGLTDLKLAQEKKNRQLHLCFPYEIILFNIQPHRDFGFGKKKKKEKKGRGLNKVRGRKTKQPTRAMDALAHVLWAQCSSNVKRARPSFFHSSQSQSCHFVLSLSPTLGQQVEQQLIFSSPFRAKEPILFFQEASGGGS